MCKPHGLLMGVLAANTATVRGRIGMGRRAGRVWHPVVSELASSHEPSWCKFDREDVDFEHPFTKRVIGILCAIPGTARVCQNPVPWLHELSSFCSPAKS